MVLQKGQEDDLSKMLREETAQRTLYSLRNLEGTIVYEPGAVASIFHNYFAKLYSLPDTLPANSHVKFCNIYLPVPYPGCQWKLLTLSTPQLQLLNLRY